MDSLEQLRRHLLVSLGAASLLGCGSNTVSGTSEEGGVTTSPSSSSANTGEDAGEDAGTSGSIPDPDPDPDPDPTPGTATSGSESETSATDSNTGSDSGPGFDLGAPDMAPLDACFVSEASEEALIEHPECPIDLSQLFCPLLYWGCVELQPGQSCEELCPEGNCVESWDNCEGDVVEEIDGLAEVCGPYDLDGQCCSLAVFDTFCGTDGRPFVVAGGSRHATLTAREGPLACSQAGLRWIAAAQAEHASIASFAQFTSQLLALAAPAALVREAIRAANDEVEHARFALARAASLSAKPLRFAALDTRGAGQVHALAPALLACVREGCIGETLAAAELLESARLCPDPTLSAQLEAIAADELRHASLAWRFVQWGLGQAPELRAEAESLLHSACASLQSPALSLAYTSPAAREALHLHGCLAADERARLYARAADALLRPCTAALAVHVR